MAAAAAAAIAFVLLSGCRADVQLGVEAGADGAGEVIVAVTLDRDAVAEIGDLAALRTDDMRDAGWTVAPPIDAGGGSVQLRASKPFATVAQANSVIDELTGPDGPFGGLQLERARSFTRTRTGLAGAVDLTPGLPAFSDADLAAKLGGEPLGLTAEEIERRLGAPAADAVTFEIAAALPGGAKASWTPRLGERLELELQAETVNWVNVTFAVLAAFCLLAAVTVVVVGGPGRLRASRLTALLDRYRK